MLYRCKKRSYTNIAYLPTSVCGLLRFSKIFSSDQDIQEPAGEEQIEVSLAFPVQDPRCLLVSHL